MALDYYKISDKAQQQILFSLHDNDIDLLEPVLKEFRRLTGISIDQCEKQTFAGSS